MKLLLCSDFSGVCYRYFKKFYTNTQGLTCLFVGYAQEDDHELESGSAMYFKEMGMKVISLKKGYKFNDKIDVVFVHITRSRNVVHAQKIVLSLGDSVNDKFVRNLLV